ncbi:hypothetical protein AOLI_G00054820 [Acnodon oligacanthus]
MMEQYSEIIWILTQNNSTTRLDLVVLPVHLQSAAAAVQPERRQTCAGFPGDTQVCAEDGEKWDGIESTL